MADQKISIPRLSDESYQTIMKLEGLGLQSLIDDVETRVSQTRDQLADRVRTDKHLGDSITGIFQDLGLAEIPMNTLGGLIDGTHQNSELWADPYDPAGQIVRVPRFGRVGVRLKYGSCGGDITVIDNGSISGSVEELSGITFIIGKTLTENGSTIVGSGYCIHIPEGDEKFTIEKFQGSTNFIIYGD